MKTGTADTPPANWARCLPSKKSFKLVALALANKIARIAWAIMASGTNFQSDLAPEHADPIPA
jgi:transposase